MHWKLGARVAGAVVVAGALAAVGWTSVATGSPHRLNAVHAVHAVHGAPAVAQAAEPGTDPKIQRWFALIEKARISFNNVLLRAEQDIRTGGATANCSSLLTIITDIKSRLPDLDAIPNGGPAIATAYLGPLNEFAAAATACTSGNFASARATLGDTSQGAIADYGAAQDKVDEILDAGA